MPIGARASTFIHTCEIETVQSFESDSYLFSSLWRNCGSDESRSATGAGVVAAGRRGEGRGVHLHDERLVLLLPLAGVLVVLERGQRIQLQCFYMRTWYSRRIELRILMRTHFLTTPNFVPLG